MSETSIRDRKRQITATHIHQIAEDMALQHGPDTVKVDDIASAAAISRRTFFNYFSTKEDAILGLQQPALTDQARTRFETSSETILVRTVNLIIDVNNTTSVKETSIKSRVAVRKKYPELTSRFDIYAAASEQLIRPVIERHAEKNDVEVLLRLAGAILRYTYTTDPDLQEDSVKQSVYTFINTINRIS